MIGCDSSRVRKDRVGDNGGDILANAERGVAYLGGLI